MDANEHYTEACHKIWERGGNPNILLYDMAELDFINGKDPDYTANREFKRQIKPKKEENGTKPHRVLYQGLPGNFQCKCGYKTTNSLSYCFHADSCTFSC